MPPSFFFFGLGVKNASRGHAKSNVRSSSLSQAARVDSGPMTRTRLIGLMSRLNSEARTQLDW